MTHQRNSTGETGMEAIQQKLRNFVTETFLFGDGADLRDDDSFIEKGIIDSTGILQVVDFVEQEFGFQVREEDLLPENLDSINQLTAFIQRELLRAPVASTKPMAEGMSVAV
jgi:acyl carrier protein